MDSMASMAMEMSASQISMDYSIAMAKKAMEDQERAAAGIIQMMQTSGPMGTYIDTYA